MFRRVSTSFSSSRLRALARGIKFHRVSQFRGTLTRPCVRAYVRTLPVFRPTILNSLHAEREMKYQPPEILALFKLGNRVYLPATEKRNFSRRITEKERD